MPFKSNRENNPFFRKCPNLKNNPNCEDTLYYSSKYTLKGANDTNRCCSSCSKYLIPRPPSVGIAVSKARKGKPLSEEHKRKVRENANPYERTTEHRRNASENIKGEKNYFFGKGDRQIGELNHMFGSSIFKKWVEKFGQEIADAKWKEMYDKREYKLSTTNMEFEIWKADRECYSSEFKIYRKKVNYFTNKNDLTKLPNFNLRGPSGKDGAYQLDHIISIKYGFEKEIAPKYIGSIDNLWFIPWEVNNKKGPSFLRLASFEDYYPISQYGYRIEVRMQQIMEWNWGIKRELPKLIRIK